MLNNTNRENEENRKIASSFPRLKSGGEGEEEGEGANPSNDCVARAIVDVMKSFGKTNASVADVDAWIRANYGNNGVPSSKFVEVMSHFFEGSETSLPSNYTYSASSGERYIVVEHSNNTGDGHAGMLLGSSGSSGSSVAYQNTKNGKKDLNFCTSGEVAMTYKITGTK
jgi:hypothetical protein